LGALFAFFSLAQVSAADVSHPQVGPCSADIARFCPKVPIGDGRRINCLADHLQKLAPDCKKRVPLLKKLFEFGKEQEAKTQQYLKTHPNSGIVPPQSNVAPKPPPPKSSPKAQSPAPGAKSI
jgi:hypothetical protein